MNVVRREKEKGIHSFRGREHKFKNRNDSGFGIMGPLNYNPKGLPPNNTNMPRYNLHTATQNCMGPPAAIPRQNKRKLPTSNPNDFETSTSNSSRRKILAEDISADSSFFTPKNRPLKYISSSSKGKSQSHSARSTTTTSNSVAESCVILAISEGRGLARGEVGIAAIDLKHPQIVLCQLSDSLLYTDTLTKINFFRPVEIIIPHTFCEGQPTALFKVLSRTYPNIPLQKVQRRHFNDAIGLQQIKNLCAPQYSGVSLLILHKFYALTAAAAVLKYVEYIQCIVFANHSLKVDYHCSDNSMLIDINTAERLELVQPLDKSAGMSCSLLGVLGPTLTCPGARLLRASILQPSCSREEIEARLDSVQELIEDSSGLFATLQNTVKKLADVDKILFLCIDSSQQDVNKMCEAQLNQTLTLKTTMELVPSIIEALASANSGKFRKIKMDLEHTDYVAIRDRIKDIIREDAHMEKGTIGTLQRCFAIKPDINGLLDVARRTYSELIDEIQKLVEHLSETHDLQLKLTQSSTKGFHIVLPIAPKNRRNFAVEELPDVFIKVHEALNNAFLNSAQKWKALIVPHETTD